MQKESGNRGLNCLLVGQVVSQMGDSIFMISLMWLVLDLTGSKAAMGTVAALSNLPILLFGLLGGVAADLLDRRKLMLGMDGLRAVAVLVLPVTMLCGTLGLPAIYMVAFVLALGATFFTPARDAIIPELVPGEQLMRANSLIQASHFAAILLGPALAAALLTVVDLIYFLVFDAATFVVSFLAIMLIRYRPTEQKAVSHRAAGTHLREILGHVMRDKRLRFLLILTGINNFFIMGPAIVGTPVFVKEILQEEAASYALVESALGLGMVLGSVLVTWASHRAGKGKLLLLGMVFDGVTYAVLYYCGSLAWLAGLIAFHALGIPFIIVSRTSMVQGWVPGGMQGRVFGLVGMAVVGTTAISCGVVGILADSIPINVIFGIFGCCATLCGVVGFCYRGLRQA